MTSTQRPHTGGGGGWGGVAKVIIPAKKIAKLKAGNTLKQEESRCKIINGGGLNIDPGFDWEGFGMLWELRTKRRKILFQLGGKKTLKKDDPLRLVKRPRGSWRESKERKTRGRPHRRFKEFINLEELANLRGQKKSRNTGKVDLQWGGKDQ